MVFSSLTFLCLFLPLNLLIYFLIPGRSGKNAVLIFSSLLFYAWGEPLWVILLVFSASVDYLHGRIIEKYRGRWQSHAALVSSLIINLGLLVIFKYSGFVVENINLVFSTTFPIPIFTLPIGISFYTFQTLSYVVDVYRNEVPAQKSYAKFLMFVSLFHQLVAGPIVRYKDIATEIEDRHVDSASLSYGINRFIVGLSKKVIIANTAAELAAPLLGGNLSELTVVGAWYGIFLFAIQIYFDFSGYSDMAIGLGRMFGFTYKENFNYPYASKSAGEFWRRWHISLGSFFRDYIYIPLGGNRKFWLRNLFIVWLLTGLWHGASWNFILWGLYYGVLIALERLLSRIIHFKLPSFCGHLYFIAICLLGWALFYFEDFGQLVPFLKAMTGFSHAGWISETVKISLTKNIFFILLSILLSLPLFPWLKQKGKNLNYGFKGFSRPLINALLLAVNVAMLVGQTYNPFIYFRF